MEVKELMKKRVKCIYCKKPIHINNWAGMNKQGFICDNGFCLIELANDILHKRKQEDRR